jgi:lysyl-tRNA synthetase class 2
LSFIDRIEGRARLLARLRSFFADRGFWEVETPLASAEIIPELHIEPRRVLGERSPVPEWLQASPELHMKRLMVAGCAAIYQVTRSFRSEEWGQLHRPEFTLVEWYRRGDDLDHGMTLLGELACALFEAPHVERLSYAEAFARHVGLDPHRAAPAELAAAAQRHGIDVPEGFPGEDRDEWLNLLLALRVEPYLGASAPTLLYHYPASQSALARTTLDAEGRAVAERFELYYRGVELANGYHELTDAAELRARLDEVNARRVAGGKVRLPLPESLLEAMVSPGLPPCAGCALGFDRAAMLALGVETVGDVRWD